MNQIEIKKVKKELQKLKRIKELSNFQAVQNLTKTSGELSNYQVI